MQSPAKFRQRIRSSDLIIGTWMQIPHPIIAELMAQVDFDFILLDGEHAPVPPDVLHTILPAIERFNAPVLYRVRSNNADLIKAALDNGVTGLMVPMINSGRDAAAVVSAAKYAPLGKRGMGPWRASNYYLDETSYVATANETPVVVQIETKEALSAVEEIAAMQGIDALYVGPADLAMSLGLPVGKLNDELRAACGKVASAARRNELGAGIDVASLDFVKTYRELGFNLMTYGLDTMYLISGGREAAAKLRNA